MRKGNVTNRKLLAAHEWWGQPSQIYEKAIILWITVRSRILIFLQVHVRGVQVLRSTTAQLVATLRLKTEHAGVGQTVTKDKDGLPCLEGRA